MALGDRGSEGKTPEKEKRETLESEQVSSTLDELLDREHSLNQAEPAKLSSLYSEAESSETKIRVLRRIAENGVGEKDVVETIVKAIDDEDPEVREKGFETLEMVDLDKSSIPVLVDALEKRGTKNIYIHNALEEVGENPAVELTRYAATTGKQDLRWKAIKAASEIGRGNAETLVRLLLNGSESTKETVSEVLKWIESDEKLELLLGIIDGSDDPKTREHAAYILGESRDPRVVPHLDSTLKNDDNLSVRKKAAEALGKIDTESADQVLNEVIEDVSVDNRIRMAARKALK